MQIFGRVLAIFEDIFIQFQTADLSTKHEWHVFQQVCNIAGLWGSAGILVVPQGIGLIETENPGSIKTKTEDRIGRYSKLLVNFTAYLQGLPAFDTAMRH